MVLLCAWEGLLDRSRDVPLVISRGASLMVVLRDTGFLCTAVVPEDFFGIEVSLPAAFWVIQYNYKCNTFFNITSNVKKFKYKFIERTKLEFSILQKRSIFLSYKFTLVFENKYKSSYSREIINENDRPTRDMSLLAGVAEDRLLLNESLGLEDKGRLVIGVFGGTPGYFGIREGAIDWFMTSFPFTWEAAVVLEGSCLRDKLLQPFVNSSNDYKRKRSEKIGSDMKSKNSHQQFSCQATNRWP